MGKGLILALLIIVSMFSIAACSNDVPDVNDLYEEQQKEQQKLEEQQREENEALIESLDGVRVSEWYKSEEYGKDVIDIMNFDDFTRIVKVETVCYDENGDKLESNDVEILEIPAESQYTWVPMCPEGTESYTIELSDVQE